MEELMASEAKSFLGVDLNLINADDARSKIANSCVKCYFQENSNHLHNWSDCSGFLKAVQRDLHLRPFVGDANSIFGEIDEGSDWVNLGSGSDALMRASHAAEQGSLTVGVWKNPVPGKKGHVAIVLFHLPLLDTKPERQAIAAWGQIGG